VTAAARRAGLLLLVLLAVLCAAGPAAAAPPATGVDVAAAADAYRAERALVIGVPGLLSSDLDPARTPQLWSLAQDAAIGALSVRAGRSTTCVLDGWSTLGAGNRARYPGPAEALPPVPVDGGADDGGADDGGADDGAAGDAGAGTAPVPALDTSLSYCGLEEQVASLGLHDPQTTVARVAEDPATHRFGAEPAALGAAVGCATVVGRAASLAAAGTGTRLDIHDDLPEAGAPTAALLTGCPLTLVSLDQLAGLPAGDGAAGSDPTGEGPGSDTGAGSTARQEAPRQEAARQRALAAVDEQVGRLRAAVSALPGSTLLLLAGISEVNDGRPQLHVALAAGPGLAPGWLTSASTGRAPFVQLIDVAPTVLRALGIEQPDSMNGQPDTVRRPRPALPEALAVLAEANTRATVHYRSTGAFFGVLVGLNAAALAAGVLVLGRRSPLRGAAARRGRALLRTGCLTVAAVPVATYLANATPWQAAGAPGWALGAAVAVTAVLVGALAGLGPWRRTRTGPAVVVLAVTLATLVGDVLTGSHLELDGLLGYDAIVAGRFVGYGNLTSGLFATCALLLTAAGAAACARRGPGGDPPRRRWLLPVLAAGSVAVPLVGAPSLGRDFGGVLAVVPGFLLLGMLLARIRVTVARLAAVLAAAVAVVAVVAVLDWLRPAAERSHLGRFVAQLLDGQAWTVVLRKGEANLSILVGSTLSWMLLVALVAAVWLLRPAGLLRSRPGRGPAGLVPADARVLRAGLTATALSLAVGAAVNDSGVAVPATAAAVLVPLLVWLAAGERAAPAGDDGVAEGTPGSTPGGGASRVSVSARGSTG
jgi:hypothetical protein